MDITSVFYRLQLVVCLPTVLLAKQLPSITTSPLLLRLQQQIMVLCLVLHLPQQTMELLQRRTPISKISVSSPLLNLSIHSVYSRSVVLQTHSSNHSEDPSLQFYSVQWNSQLSTIPNWNASGTINIITAGQFYAISHMQEQVLCSEMVLLESSRQGLLCNFHRSIQHRKLWLILLSQLQHPITVKSPMDLLRM